MIPFRVQGLSPEPFRHLYGLSDEQLAAAGAQRYVVDTTPGFPDRIEMRDMEPGESAILINYEHQSAPTPYRSCHAVFVREGATRPYDAVNIIPEVMRVRLLSLRSFDASGEMLDADVVDGSEIEMLIERLFARTDAKYIHVHNAKRGCYSGLITRT